MKIIVAVSGGPDSMALLDILYNEGYEIIVAHVNYKLRDTADRDQEIVEEYCRDHQIKLEVLEDSGKSIGNFQAYARELRYNFMEQLAKKYSVDKVYVAHHLDDVLETYLIQKRRGIVPSYYGINSESMYKSINLIRPLLERTKDDLVKYCDDHKLSYGVDESNYTKTYLRNKIRHEDLKDLSEDDKRALLKNIEELNDKLKLEQEVTKKNLMKFKKNYDLKLFSEFAENESINLLRLWFSEYNIYGKSTDEFINVLKFIKSNSNGEYLLDDDYILSKSYDRLYLVLNQEISYQYIIKDVEYLSTPYFSIMEKGESVEAVTLTKKDFPLIIRNFKVGDKIKMFYGTKNVSRFFIDKKIPIHLRKKWPIVENADGDVILVPGLGCDSTHYSNNPTLFVVK